MASLGGSRVIAVHISARKPSQRWPAERFVALMRSLHAAESCAFALFWSPGAADNPLHPGDDDKARRIVDELGRFPVLPMRTDNLEQLIAGLAPCSAVICSDGGAMHVAAALGKPILCLFGDSDAVRWHPWGVRYELLQAASRDVADISVEDALASWRRLTG
jgi:ADP-heptose:LPS heptosyltransferase